MIFTANTFQIYELLLISKVHASCSIAQSLYMVQNQQLKAEGVLLTFADL